MSYNFPFGSELKKVEQQDKSPKEVFVLGVYASAVHAKWIDNNGKVKVNALAVASEPSIFWPGNKEQVIEIINEIYIPEELGRLEPADPRFNGISGRLLDKDYLFPLGYSREKSWLCDIIPFSRSNTNQVYAIRKHYTPILEQHNLPLSTIPPFSISELTNDARRKEILEELKQSKAETIILLGDYPIKYFLSHYTDKKSLSDFGDKYDNYGIAHDVNIEGKTYKVYPLAHPRQSGKLGRSIQSWADLHEFWRQGMILKE